MRTTITLVAAFIVGSFFPHPANCQQDSVLRDAEVIESTILWKAELDEVTWLPIELDSVLRNTDRYTKTGNFYKVEETVYVFEHVAIYIGMLGVEMVPGPNAVLQGEPASISAAINNKYQISFVKDGNGYVSELEKHVKLIVAPHPNIKNATIVIGAYFGP